MVNIIAFLKDPSWWFTAFFFAIITSVIAGFTKDRIESVISKLSRALSEKQKIKEEEHKIAIETLSENEGFLIISMVRGMGMTIMTLIISMMSLVSPMFSVIAQKACELAPNDPTCGIPDFYFVMAFLFFFGLLGVVTGYKASKLMDVNMRAYKIYRDKREFPLIR